MGPPKNQSQQEAAEFDLLRHVLSQKNPWAILGAFESVLGFCLTCFFAVFIVLIGGGIVLFRGVEQYYWNYRQWLPFALAWTVATVLCGLSVRFLSRPTFTGLHPIPLSVARKGLTLPVLARPFVAAWWLMLAVALLFVAHSCGELPESMRNTNPVFYYVSPWLYLMTASVCMNTNLLLALASFTGSDVTILWAWRLRLIIDVLATVSLSKLHIPAMSDILTW